MNAPGRVTRHSETGRLRCSRRNWLAARTTDHAMQVDDLSANRRSDPVHLSVDISRSRNLLEAFAGGTSNQRFQASGIESHSVPTFNFIREASLDRPMFWNEPE